MCDFFMEFKEQPYMALGNLCLYLSLPCVFSILGGFSELDTSTNLTTPTLNISNTTATHLVVYGLAGLLVCILGGTGVYFAHRYDLLERRQ